MAISPSDFSNQDIGFSSSGSAGVSNPTSGGTHIDVPTFLESGSRDPVTDGVDMADPTTPREEAFRDSGLGSKLDREQAPKL
jgi:hypothetical protein